MTLHRTPSRSHPRSFARRAVAALAVVGLLGLAACSSDSSADGDGNGDGKKIPLTIAYQNIPNGDLVVKNSGWLEKALPGYEIEWKLFDSGGSVNEAFAGGSIDIGLAGSSPVSRGLSAPIAYKVPWIHDVIGSAEALAVQDGITSITDLVGKKVAVPFASTAHYSLLAALETAGVDPTTVDIIDAEPDAIAAAWSQGSIDAAYVWNPVLAQLVSEGATILTDSADVAASGKTTYDLAVVSTKFATDHPEAVQEWVAQQSRAVELYRSDPDTWAKAVGAELSLDPVEVLDQAAGLIFLTAEEQAGPEYLGGGLGTNLVATASFNLEAKSIDAVLDKDAYLSAVYPDAVDAVAKG
ncbi:taurine transport system substrate-binding protein [Sanguibacter gelidistatuariae]|uniref:Taurine transport system substrate-binding protein n=1 Tax=Sanguibacter gelidistatuariae TaxID=1814289 RepID=A0A1G6H0A3_9MICO|nr:ABC transporter substrate-binding protein [Sanguibacter gelidistatuariae]SDB87689.1 taurine transport system substrate-binding protein [Sanguibacter gelidistatuariae]